MTEQEIEAEAIKRVADRAGMNLENWEAVCILTEAQIRELLRLLSSDEKNEWICTLSNSFGYEKIREMILTGEILSLLESNPPMQATPQQCRNSD